DDLGVKRAAQFVNGFHAATAVSLEKPQRRHDEPRAHLALILVTQVGIGRVMTVIAIQDGPGPLLGEPGLSGPVEEPGHVHRRLVPLIYWSDIVPVAHGVESRRCRFFEALIKTGDKAFVSHRLYQARHI